MKPKAAQPMFRSAVITSARHAFSLIEMMGVLAVVILLSLILVPALIKKVDRVVLEKEDAVLKEMAESFKTYIRRTRTIPDESTYLQALSQEMGYHLDHVSQNQKGRSRLLMIDPALRIGTDTNQVLPYTQTIAGSIKPIQPRVMLLSTLGDALPATITNGVAASTQVFNELWALDDGDIPASWTNWNRGYGKDLRVQRIYLADLFVQVLLYNDQKTLGLYSVDALATNTMPATTPRTVETYFLLDTELGLHDVHGDPEAYEVLYQPSSYFFELGLWRGRFQGVDVGYPGGFNLQVVSELFLNAPTNPNAKSVNDPSNQVKIIQAIEDYINSYLDWATAGFPSHPSGKKDLDDAEDALATYSVNLLFKP